MTFSSAEAEQLLKHLKRAGHDTLGKSHFAREGEETTFGDLVEDVPCCYWGMWLIEDPEMVDEEDAPRAQCTECVCDYSDLLNLFEPGEEERARVDRNYWRDCAERAVDNRHQAQEWFKKHGDTG